MCWGGGGRGGVGGGVGWWERCARVDWVGGGGGGRALREGLLWDGPPSPPPSPGDFLVIHRHRQGFS